MVTLDLDNPEWMDFVRRHPLATLFHHPAWSHLLADCYGYRPFAIAARGHNGELIAGMPVLEIHSLIGNRRWVSLPFTDHCPPLANGECDIADLTNSLADQFAGDISELEVRAALPSGKNIHLTSNAVVHLLGLSSDEDAVFRSFKLMHRRGILKSQREGVSVRRGTGDKDLNSFYRLHVQTRRRLGVPVQPRRFFELLWKSIIETELGFLLMAFKDDTPLAGAIFFAWNGTIIYKYGASDPTYWKLRPNNSVMWNAIRWGCQKGYHTLDFGRTDLEDIGLRDFKSGWGSREEPLVYSVMTDRPVKSSYGHLADWMRVVIRHSPPVVCRVLGDLLYRYAA